METALTKRRSRSPLIVLAICFCLSVTAVYLCNVRGQVHSEHYTMAQPVPGVTDKSQTAWHGESVQETRSRSEDDGEVLEESTSASTGGDGVGEDRLPSDMVEDIHSKLAAGLRGGHGLKGEDRINLFVPSGFKLDVQTPTGITNVSIDNVCTTKQRLSKLQAVCHRHQGEISKNVDFNIPGMYTNFIVDDLHKVIYCNIPKVSCTVWKDLLALRSGRITLEQLLTPDEEGKIPAFEIHRMRLMTKLTGIYALSSLAPETIRDKLASYKKMMIVRNPFSRLYSGYSDKMVIENKGFSFGGNIHAVYPDLTLTNGGMFITFEQFLNMLAQAKKSNNTKVTSFANNGHWRSMESMCHPCHVHYDYIAKLETMNIDKNNLFKWFNATDKDLLSTTRPSYTKYTNVFNYTLPHISDIYRTIPAQLIKQIRDIYKFDLELFGYDYDLEKGSLCENKSPDSGCC